MKEGKNGVTSKTPEQILFGAGTIHKNLKYAEGTGWNFKDSIVGATSGGSKLSIVPEIYYPEIDGVPVKLKETATKVGETATMEINFIELTKEIIKASTLGADGNSLDDTFDLIESKSDIVADDFWENIAFVGVTLNGKKVIAILDNPLCTNGFEQEGKNKEGAVGKYTFECHAGIENEELDKLPWHIYYPKNA
jgi:hypothetical protein